MGHREKIDMTAQWRLEDLDARHEAVAKAYAAGRPVKEIAEEYGCAVSYPGWCAKQAGERLRRAGGVSVAVRRPNGTIKWVRR